MEGDPDEIELAIQNLTHALPNDFPKERILALKERMTELRPTEEELEHLDRQQKLGYIKDDDYLHRHDQLNLRKNVLIERLKEESVTPFADAIKDGKSKSRIRKIADTIVSYKDVIRVLAEIAGAAARGFATGQ